MKHKMFLIVAALVLLFINIGFAQAEPDEIVWLKTRNEMGIQGKIINALFSPDEQSILVTAEDKFVEVDAMTGAFKREMPGNIAALKFSDDGQYLYVCNADDIGLGDYLYYGIKKLQYPSMVVVAEFETYPWRFNAIDINEKAGVLIGIVNHSPNMPTPDSAIAVYDLNSFRIKRVLDIEGNYFSSLKITPDGSKFLTLSIYDPDLSTGSENRPVKMLWDSKKLEILHEITGVVGEYKFSPDGRWLASVAINTVRVFDANTWEQRFEWKHNETNSGSLSALDFSPDSKFLATCGVLGGFSESAKKIADIHIWDLEVGQLYSKYNNGTNMVASQEKIYFSQNGNYLLGVASAGIMLYPRISTSINEDIPNNEISLIFPNPTTGDISIKSSDFKAGHLKLELTDIKGSSLKILYDRYYQNEELKFDISYLPIGTYFLKAVQNKLVLTYKIIKER